MTVKHNQNSLFSNCVIWALLIIVGLAAVLRLYNLNSLPTILNRDEAALAYNAFLLNEVGQDEWNRSWPLALESFGDYKLPGYVWSLVGVFKIFGYHDWVVRLPSAIAGTVLVILMYGWAKTLKFTELEALTAALITAILPLFFFYSRIGFEANVALAMLVGVLMLLQIRSKASDIAAILLALISVFTYNTPFLLLPFIIVGIPLLRGLKQWQKWWLVVSGLIMVFVVAGLVLLPLTMRKSGITIFTDQTVWLNSVEYRQHFVGWQQKVFGNRYVFMTTVLFKNVVTSLSPEFLVTKGGTHPWHQLPGYAHLGWIVYGLGMLGLAAAVYGFKKHWWLLYLLLISLAPAVITVDAPHATRSLLFFAVWVLLAVVGLRTITSILTSRFELEKHQFIRHSIGLVIVAAIMLESAVYFSAYFTKYPLQSSEILESDFETMLLHVEGHYPTVPVAIVDKTGFKYTVVAWYLKMPAEEFLTTVVKQQPNQIGFAFGQQVGRYHFVNHIDDRREQEKIVLEFEDYFWRVKEF